MPRKLLGSLLASKKASTTEREKTVRRAPPRVGAAVSYRYDITSKRLQAVEYEQYDGTVYFKLKGDSARTVGYVRLNLQGKEELNVDFLEVYKPFRKNGYGREIYQWIESYAKERGIKKITVISYQEAIGFWEKMGLKRGVWSKPGYQSMARALDDSQTQGKKPKLNSPLFPVFDTNFVSAF